MSVASAKGLAENIGIQNLEQVLATGNDAGGLDIIGVDNVVATTINGVSYPPPAKSISLYDYTVTNITINAGSATAITGSVVLPAGTYALFATVIMTSPSPLVDLFECSLLYGATSIQTFKLQLNSTLTAPVVDDATVPLSTLVLSDTVSALTITALANGDAGTVTVDAFIRYYKLD